MRVTKRNIPSFFATEWKERRALLLRKSRWDGRLAQVFFACTNDSYWRAQKRILYVGKATAGDYNASSENSFYFGCNHSAFWSLGRRLGSRFNPESVRGLSSIAWSNLLKIGTASGNPSYKLAEEQHDLAVKTLKAEIEHFDPSLLVCVAANYCDEVLYEALGRERGKDGFSEEEGSGRKFYHRAAVDGFPPILWLDHPQGKKKAYIDAVMRRADSLLS